MLGCKLVTMPKFDPGLFLKILKGHGVTVAHVAPPLVNFLAKHPVIDTVLPLPKLKELFSGAAPLGPELIEASVLARSVCSSACTSCQCTGTRRLFICLHFMPAYWHTASIHLPSHTLPPVSKWRPNPLFEMFCISACSGAGCKPRLESRIKKIQPCDF